MWLAFVIASAIYLIIPPPVSFPASSDPCKEYASKGEFDKAIDECTKQIYGEIPVKYPEYSYNNRGAAYANKEQYDQAIADYNKAIGLNPRYATAYYNRAIAHAKKKNFKKAIADFDKAIDLNPEYAEARAGREQVAAELKRSKAAPVADIKADTSDKKPVSAASQTASSSHSQMPAASAARSPARSQGRKSYAVQLGVFRIEGNAAALASRLREKGYDPEVSKVTANDGVTLHRVFIGSFENRQEAAKLAAQIKEKENIEPIVASR